MFTGIVERTATVRELTATGGGRRLTVEVEAAPHLPPWRPVEIGESIAVSGVCLTAVGQQAGARGAEVSFDAVPETLSRSTLGALGRGDPVNLERSLRAGDLLGGHYVTGHIDGTGTVVRRERQGDQTLFTIEAAAPLLREVIPKGSIALDGISLTVVEIDRGKGLFTIAVIPHTLERTTLGAREAGSRVNLETDAFGKWIIHALENVLQEPSGPEAERRWRRLLERAGYGEEPGT